MKNIHNTNLGNKIIISKKCFHREDLKPEFNKYETKEEKRLIKSEAKYIYSKLLNSENNSYYSIIDSAIIRINCYSVAYNSQVFTSSGKLINETDTLMEYEYGYNPYYYKKLVSELNKLARKDNLFLDISLKEKRDMGTYIIVISSLTKEQFEGIYEITLDQYYESMTKKSKKGYTKEESRFRSEIEKLRESYIEFMIADINKGFDKSDIEMDGYIAYLQISCKYSSIDNKEEILREYGFELNEQNQSLVLKSNRELMLELK